MLHAFMHCMVLVTKQYSAINVQSIGFPKKELQKDSLVISSLAAMLITTEGTDNGAMNQVDTSSL